MLANDGVMSRELLAEPQAITRQEAARTPPGAVPVEEGNTDLETTQGYLDRDGSRRGASGWPSGRSASASSRDDSTGLNDRFLKAIS